MTKQRHERIAELFGEACELNPTERARLLDEACAADPELRAELQKLLAKDAEPDSFLDTPALGDGFELRGSSASPESAAAAELPERIGEYRVLAYSLPAPGALRMKPASHPMELNLATWNLGGAPPDWPGDLEDDMRA